MDLKLKNETRNNTARRPAVKRNTVEQLIAMEQMRSDSNNVPSTAIKRASGLPPTTI
jgi:hypothetical protein